MTYQQECEYLESLKVYWNYRYSSNLWSNSCTNPSGKRRIVNQKEIIEFIRLNPVSNCRLFLNNLSIDSL